MENQVTDYTITDVVTESANKGGIKTVIGVGLAMGAGALLWNRVAKPIARKIKAHFEAKRAAKAAVQVEEQKAPKTKN